MSVVRHSTWILAIELLAVGCGDDSDPSASSTGNGESSSTFSTSLSDPTATSTPPTTQGQTVTGSGEATETGDPGPSAQELPDPTPWELDWTFIDIGDGSKPALSTDGSNGVHVAYMYEELDGWVRHVQIPAGSTEAPAFTGVASGYFYGPIDVAARSDGAPVIAYHDHDLEDQVLAVPNGSGGFVLDSMGAAGHDGWYPTAVVDAADVVHTATIDPVQFEGVGVNYGRYDGEWTVENAAPGPLDYKNGVSIAVVGSGVVYIAYFDDVLGTANVARRTLEGVWELRLVEGPGDNADAGYFPQLRVGSDSQTLHMTYLVRTAMDAGVIRYARGPWGDIELFNLAEIDDLPIGMPLGTARTPASIALLQDDTPVIAYQNGTELRVAMITADALMLDQTENAADGVTYGRQTAIEVTPDGVLHVAYYQDDGGVPATVRYGWAAL